RCSPVAMWYISSPKYPYRDATSRWRTSRPAAIYATSAGPVVQGESCSVSDEVRLTAAGVACIAKLLAILRKEPKKVHRNSVSTSAGVRGLLILINHCRKTLHSALN